MLDDVPAAAFLKKATIIAMNEIQISGVASEQSNLPKLKTFADQIIVQRAELNEELKALATLKKVNLPMDKPQGGLRPDGRIDSAPENLQDTTRNQNQAEAAGANESGTMQKNGLENVERLKKLKGDELNQAYIALMMEEQKQLISLFQMAASNNDKDVKSFASKHIGSFKANLKALTALKKK